MSRYLIPLAVGAALNGTAAFAQTVERCADEACFLQAVQNCEAAVFDADEAAAVGAARYRVLGREGGACQIEFIFTANPDPDLVDKPLSFLVDPAAASEGMLLGAVESCLTGRDDGFECTGPLSGQSAGPGPSLDMVAGTGPMPCGATPAPAEGPPLYPMPKDGKWGYVDRDGAWQIAPQWDRAQDFHEGRAAVGSPHAWGIIDREGRYVVEMRHQGQSTVEIDGQRWVESPFAPYSQGCTVANVFTEKAHPPFFIDREGKAYWHDDLPEALATRDIRAFGTFSEGLAWFQQNHYPDARFGWVDADGNVVIEADFFSAGRFSGGLAPASSREGQAGFISPDGRLQLPRKWTLEGAEPFSEGLAQVWTGPFDIAFMDREDFVFDRVTFGADRGGRPAEAEITAAGAFHDGLAPVSAGSRGREDFVFVDRTGEVAFVPDDLDGIALCESRSRPEFHNGLVRLIVADDGKTCSGTYHRGMADVDDAHYVYLDSDGTVALQQAR